MSYWLPTNDPALAFWLDRTDAASITLNTGKVSAWASQGSGLPSFLSDASSQWPTWGGDHVAFDGTNLLTSALSASPSKRTIIAVVALTGSGDRTILGSSNTGGLQMRASANNKPVLIGQGLFGIGEASTALATGAKTVVACSWDTATKEWKWRVGGLPAGSGTTNVALSAGLTTWLGARGNGGENGTFKLWQLVGFDEVYTDAELARAEAAIVWHDENRGDLLDNSHAFRSGPPTTEGLPVTATASITEAADTVLAAGYDPSNEPVAPDGYAFQPDPGTGGFLVDPDTGEFLMAPLVGEPTNVRASITEAPDTVTATARVKITGRASITEASDTLVSSNFIGITATASITEAADTVAATGSLTAHTEENVESGVRASVLSARVLALREDLRGVRSLSDITQDQAAMLAQYAAEAADLLTTSLPAAERSALARLRSGLQLLAA